MAQLDQGVREPGHPSCERETEIEHEDLYIEWSISVAFWLDGDPRHT
jgi:hypothetical protein